MSNKLFIKKVESCIKGLSTTEAPFDIKEIHSVAEGVVIVFDTMDEYDAYFDPELWEFKIPKIWKEARDGIGMLPGIGIFPKIQNFEEALWFVMSQLQPIKDVEWCRPKIVSIT